MLQNKRIAVRSFTRCLFSCPCTLLGFFFYFYYYYFANLLISVAFFGTELSTFQCGNVLLCFSNCLFIYLLSTAFKIRTRNWEIVVDVNVCIVQSETRTKKRLQSCKDDGNIGLARKKNDCCEGTSDENFMLLFRFETDYVRLMYLKTLTQLTDEKQSPVIVSASSRVC